jgi:hypothetical protein
MGCLQLQGLGTSTYLHGKHESTLRVAMLSPFVSQNATLLKLRAPLTGHG